MGGMGQALAMFSGQNCGAQRFDRVRKGVLISVSVAVISAAMISAFILIFPELVIHIFNDDPAVLVKGTEIFWFVIPFYFLYGFIDSYGAAIRGAGQSIITMISGIANLCILRIVFLAIFMPIFPHAITASLCYPISWLMASSCLLIYFYFFPWKERYLKEWRKREAAKGAANASEVKSALQK